MRFGLLCLIVAACSRIGIAASGTNGTGTARKCRDRKEALCRTRLLAVSRPCGAGRRHRGAAACGSRRSVANVLALRAAADRRDDSVFTEDAVRRRARGYLRLAASDSRAASRQQYSGAQSKVDRRLYAWSDAVRGGAVHRAGCARGDRAERQPWRRDDESRRHQRAERRGSGEVLHRQDGVSRSVPRQRRQGTSASRLHADQQEHVSRAEPGERTAAGGLHALRACMSTALQTRSPCSGSAA